MADITYDESNDTVTRVLKDGRQIGVITHRNGDLGFRIFGEPLGGSVGSVDDAKTAIEKHYE